MKKIIIFLILISIWFQSYALSENEREQYKKWSLSNNNFSSLYFDYGQYDCLWFTSDFSGSWDLLSSLIIDQKFRDEMSGKQDLDNDWNYEPNPTSLKVYTPEYILNLDKTLAKKLKKNFYARYVCHIGDNTDIIAGSYKSAARISNVLILRNGNNVFILPKKIQIYGNSYTWGDVEHCKASMEDKNNITWRCWLGFLRDKSGVIWDQSKVYTIWLKNGKLLQTTIVESKL